MQSEVGKGTCILVHLPLGSEKVAVESDGEDPQQGRASQQGQPFTGSNTGQPTLLKENPAERSAALSKETR